MDALEYLGGYILHNLHPKVSRNMDKNGDALEILKCPISETVEGQALINLQTRGGLTGLNRMQVFYS